MSAPTILLIVPPAWAPFWMTPLIEAAPSLRIVVHERDTYEPLSIDYAMCFRPHAGLLKALPNLRVVFSLGAGVDGILSDREYPKHVPLVRLVDHTLSRDMMHYIVLHTLMFHRQQRLFDGLQRERKWRQMLPWSRTPKRVPGIESFAGATQLPQFLGRSDILVCVLPLTPDTRGILDCDAFAQLPRGAYVINVARGGHLVELDLIAAIDSGQLAGAALDVFAQEPLPETSPLWSHPKVSLTPHIAALSDPRAVARATIEGVRQFERGEALANAVDLARGY
jgi:glyoxylate/hydroxypyruvate reductase A